MCDIFILKIIVYMKLKFSWVSGVLIFTKRDSTTPEGIWQFWSP